MEVFPLWWGERFHPNYTEILQNLAIVNYQWRFHFDHLLTNEIVEQPYIGEHVLLKDKCTFTRGSIFNTHRITVWRSFQITCPHVINSISPCIFRMDFHMVISFKYLLADRMTSKWSNVRRSLWYYTFDVYIKGVRSNLLLVITILINVLIFCQKCVSYTFYICIPSFHERAICHYAGHGVWYEHLVFDENYFFVVKLYKNYIIALKICGVPATTR